MQRRPATSPESPQHVHRPRAIGMVGRSFQQSSHIATSCRQPYKNRCVPVVTKGTNGKIELRRPIFPIVQYVQERKQEEAILRDGVFEMMCLRQYQHWMAKARNGGIPHEVSRVNFEAELKIEKLKDVLGLSQSWLKGLA